jgi:hypothetical protein
MSALAPGTHVVVTAAGGLTGKTGVVVECARVGDANFEYEVAVLLDEDTVRDDIAALGFYTHELQVAS